MSREPRAFFAISATNLQGVIYPQKDYFAWLKDQKPVAVLGHSLFIFDVTNDLPFHEKAARLFHAKPGFERLAMEEERWVQRLSVSEHQ